MDRKPRDLCGMAAMGNIFSWLGGLSLIESHSTIRDWPALTFLMASAAKCSNASLERADWCGPHLIASHISAFNQGRPVCVGQPNFDHSCKSSPAGWDVAIPDGHMLPCHVSGRDVGVGSCALRWWVVHAVACSCCSWRACRRRLFCRVSLSMSLPTTGSPVASIVGGESPSR